MSAPTPELTPLELGQDLLWKDRVVRVVRIVRDDTSLFETKDSSYTIQESYAQVIGEDGIVDFIVFSSAKIPFIGPKSKIKALQPIPLKGIVKI